MTKQVLLVVLVLCGLGVSVDANEPASTEIMVLARLAGAWIGTYPASADTKGGTVRMKLRMSENNSAMYSEVSIAEGEGTHPVSSGMYYWNPKTRQIAVILTGVVYPLLEGEVVVSKDGSVILQEMSSYRKGGALGKFRSRLTFVDANTLREEGFEMKDGKWIASGTVLFRREK